MKRRKTVSVTPAMGASTVAGAMRTFPIVRDEGTGTTRVVAGDSPAPGPELSQYLRMSSRQSSVVSRQQNLNADD